MNEPIRNVHAREYSQDKKNRKRKNKTQEKRTSIHDNIADENFEK